MIWRLIYRKARMQNRTVQSVLDEVIDVSADKISDSNIYLVTQKKHGKLKGAKGKKITFDYLTTEAIAELKAYLEL